MRPNQNRRMRGRNRPKGPNPLTRSYESNGPDVKIRGTAQHIADKYAQLARDAQAAGDPVAAENYFQHGEHYFRIVSGAQEHSRPANAGGYAARPYDDDMDEGDDEQGGQPNGHAYNGYDDGDPGQQPQPYDSRPDQHQDARQQDSRQNRDRFQNRDQRRFDNGARQDYRRQDQPRQDYQRQDGPRQDHQRQDHQRQDGQRPDYQRQDYPRPDNRGEGRQDYGRPDYRQDARQEPRQDRQDNRQASRQDFRGDQGRFDGPRQDSRQEQPRAEAPRNDAPRQAEFAPRRERRREDVAPAADEPAGLPAFLMAPARPAPAAAPAEPDEAAPEAVGDEMPAPKPRRRRRPRFESAATAEGEPRGSTEDAPTE